MKEVKIYIDVEKQRLVYSPIILTQYYSDIIMKFIIGLPTKSLENEVPFDTSEVEDEEITLESISMIRFILPNGEEVVDELSSDIYKLPTAVTSIAGSIDFELTAYYSDGSTIPLPGKLYVNASSTTDSNILKDDRYPILTKLIEEVSNLKEVYSQAAQLIEDINILIDSGELSNQVLNTEIDTLTTDNKTIIGAINELNNKLGGK